MMDIPQAIADAEDTLRDLRRQAEAAVASGSPREIQQRLEEISMAVGQLRLRIPVSDYEGRPIAAGRALDDEVGAFSIWLDEQYERFTINSDGRRLSTKQQGSYNGFGPIAAVVEWIKDKIADLFTRTEEVQRQEEAEAEDTSTAIARVNPGRPALQAVALRGALQTLQDHLERVSQVWENVTAEAEATKQIIDDQTAGIRAITATLGQQYAQNTAEALANNLAVRAEQWDALNARAKELRTIVLELQEQVRAVEAQVEGKAAELAERKAFWDPEDDADSAALTERIDALAARVATAIDDNDEDEQAELLAELNDLSAGLTDDTRFRVQALIERLGGGEKSAAPGAHTLYR